MENSAANKHEESKEEKVGLTPHELVQRHMNNPDEPITDEDMKNLQMKINISPEEQPDCKTLSTEEIENLEKRAINPMDVLGK